MDAPFARRHLPASPRTINQFATGSLAGKPNETPHSQSHRVFHVLMRRPAIGLCTGVVLRLFSPVLALISGLVGLALLVSATGRLP